MRKRRIVAVALGGAAVLAALALAGRGKTPLPGPARHAAAEAKLEAVLPPVRFNNVTLREAVATLGRLSGADVVLDGNPTADVYVALHVRDVTLRQALDILTGYVNSGGAEFAYTVHGGAIVLTEDLGRYAYARVYDVRDIEVLPAEAFVTSTCFGRPAPDPDAPPWRAREDADDQFVWLIQETVRPELWGSNGGAGGSVHALGGRLLVVASWEQHRSIDSLLARLRAPARPGEVMTGE